MSSQPRRPAAAASSNSFDGSPPSRVLLYGDSDELRLFVRDMMSIDFEIVGPGGEQPDLAVADAGVVTSALLEKARTEFPDVPLLIVTPSSRKAASLRVNLMPDGFDKLTLRQVMQRFGRGAVVAYLPALMRHHAGNVTRAARAAGLERESLHRLLRRHRLTAVQFRS